MGRKDNQAPKAEAKAKAAPEEKKEEEEEDTPVIKALKALDDKYCEAELKMQAEIEKLRAKFTARQAPLLEERCKVLEDASDCKPEDKENGTPGLPDFWLTVFQNCNQLEDAVQECDYPVLKYLRDIKATLNDPDCEKKGHKLEFHFAENPFFTNSTLWISAHVDYDPATAKPWKDDDCLEIKCSTVDWKPGKNVTVEKKKDAPKKGKKGGRPGKTKEEPCPSLFRMLFTPVKKEKDDDGEIPDELRPLYEDMMDEVDESELLEMHLSNAAEFCQFFYEDVVPYAVRYYTGEACEDDSDDDESGESESGDGDSEEDDSEDEPPPRKGGKSAKAKAPPTKGGGSGEGGDDKKAEECKQQ